MKLNADDTRFVLKSGRATVVHLWSRSAGVTHCGKRWPAAPYQIPWPFGWYRQCRRCGQPEDFDDLQAMLEAVERAGRQVRFDAREIGRDLAARVRHEFDTSVVPEIADVLRAAGYQVRVNYQRDDGTFAGIQVRRRGNECPWFDYQLVIDWAGHFVTGGDGMYVNARCAVAREEEVRYER